jgi:hypothetical protein
MGGKYDQEVPCRVFSDGFQERRNSEPCRLGSFRKENDDQEGQEILCAHVKGGVSTI